MALAQGHRLLRVANVLVLPAWLLGLLGLLLFGMTELFRYRYEQVGIGLAVVIGLGWFLWGGRKSLVARTSTRREDRVPGEILDLLAQIDGLIEALERGEDSAFELGVDDLDITLRRLGPGARRYLDERGADPDSLRCGVCSVDLDAKLGAELPADRRRALHHQVVRFAAMVRGRPCGDPYRSRIDAGPGLLGGFWDPALARTRRRLVVFVTVLAIGWAVGWGYFAALLGGQPLELCNAFPAEATCRIAFSLEEFVEAGVIALALLPIVMLAAAAAARRAAWRSWAAALPESELDAALLDRPGSPLPGSRRWLSLRRRTARAITGLVASFSVAVTLCRHDWGWCGFTLGEQVILIELVALSLVVIAALVDELDRRGDSRRARRRLRRRRADQAHAVRDLFTLRRELADTAPARADLLEQLAETLADAKELGRLDAGDRDRVVARLRAAAARGAALGRRERDRLLLDLESCEVLLSLRRRG